MTMNGGLSAEGQRLKTICDSAARAVAASIRDVVGSPDGGVVLEMGADGTPTKKIDRRAEEAAFASLKRSGQGFTVLSEEAGRATIGNNAMYFLHLDPLDGTFNAIRGIPFYSVSIYISRREFNFGYISDLVHGVEYYAERGRGSWAESPSGRNRLAVSQIGSLKDLSVSAYTIKSETSRVVRLGDSVRRIRTLGSTALEMAMVASGKLDAFVDLRGSLRVVDVAAGNLIVKEAGGMVTDNDGVEIHFDDGMWQRRYLVASNGLLHKDLMDLIGGEDL